MNVKANRDFTSHWQTDGYLIAKVKIGGVINPASKRRTEFFAGIILSILWEKKEGKHEVSDMRIFSQPGIRAASVSSISHTHGREKCWDVRAASQVVSILS